MIDDDICFSLNILKIRSASKMRSVPRGVFRTVNGAFLGKIGNAFQPLPTFAKISILDL